MAEKSVPSLYEDIKSGKLPVSKGVIPLDAELGKKFQQPSLFNFGGRTNDLTIARTVKVKSKAQPVAKTQTDTSAGPAADEELVYTPPFWKL